MWRRSSLLVALAIAVTAAAVERVDHENGVHFFPDGVELGPTPATPAPDAPVGCFTVRSSNGIEGSLCANTGGAFIQSPDPRVAGGANPQHYIGLFDPAILNGTCDATASTNQGGDCGGDADCGGVVGACKRDGSRCQGGANAGNLCQVSSDCPSGTCNTGTAVKNFPAQGRPVHETGGRRTFTINRRDFLLEGRPSIAPGQTGVCVKRETACLTDAGCTTKYCNGGANKDAACLSDGDCPSAMCETTRCVNLLCEKVFPFAGFCLRDADCTSPSGQQCRRGYRSFDFLIRGYDCAVDTGSVANPTGDGRIEVAADDGEANCVDTQTSGAGVASSLEHQFRWRLEIDSPGLASKASGIRRCRDSGLECTVQADCPGSECRASDPFELFHLELNSEAAQTVWKANRDGQITHGGPTVFGDGIRRCTNNPAIQCTTDADCPFWKASGGGVPTRDVCRGDEIILDSTAFLHSALPVSSLGYIKTLVGAIFRMADSSDVTVYAYTDGQSFADHQRDLRLQCDDNTCTAAATDSRRLKLRARSGSTTREWDVFASGTNDQLEIRAPGSGASTFRITAAGDLDGTTSAGSANGYPRQTRRASSSLPTCDANALGREALATATNGARTCVCEQVDSTPTYAWRVPGIRAACDSALWQYQATSGASISVIGRDVVELNYGGATTVTSLTGGVRGQRVTFICLNGNVTLQENANMNLAGAGDFVCTADDTITVVLDGSSIWREQSRSVN